LVAFSPKIIAATGLLIAAAGMFFVVRFIPNSLEYDFSKLRNKPKVERVGKNVKDRVTDLFGQNISPSIVLLQKPEQAEDACRSIMRRESDIKDHEKTIESCKSLHSYLPENQGKKLYRLGKIRRLLEDSSINFLNEEYRKELEEFRNSVNLKRVELSDLPISVRRNFEELDGTLGRIVYVYPRRDARLSNGRRLIQFSDVLSNVRLEDGSVVRMAGQAAIFADLLRAVRHDGPIATSFSFFAVALIIVINFRRKRPIIYILGGLILGIIYMLSLQSILQIKLNFFNFIAIPVTFGIGVDYGVNLLQRYRFEGRGSVRRVLGSVGGAILLCSTTTIIGYSTLLTAQSQALASFGWLALLGEFSCLFASIVVMPAILHSFDSKHSPSEPDRIIKSIAND